MTLRVNRFTFLGVSGVLCLLSLGIFFREFLTSHLNLIAGNTGDNRFIIAILEHWRAFFHGSAEFNSPNFFWPEQDVLGFSESLFLFSLPYSIARAFGADIYLSFETTLFVFKAVGFVSMLWFLRSFMRVSRATALVGSTLFSLSNLYYIAIGHAQLMAVALVPLVACLGCSAWLADDCGKRVIAYLYGAGCGFLFGMLLFTSFYIGWFSVLAASLTLIAALGFAALQNRVTWDWRDIAAKKAGLWVVTALSFCIAMIPFVLTYLPALSKTGGRNYQDNLLYSAQPTDLLNIGQTNWLWGKALSGLWLRLKFSPMVISEQQSGWPPFTLAVLLISLCWLSWRAFKGRSDPSPQRRKPFPLVWAVITASFFINWIVSVRMGTHSLWWLVFKFVPGGSAIRVPARFNIVLNILVVLAVCLVLDHLKSWRGRLGYLSFVMASALILLEQINLFPSHAIQRDYENALIGRVQKAPVECKSFFLSSPLDPNRPTTPIRSMPCSSQDSTTYLP